MKLRLRHRCLTPTHAVAIRVYPAPGPQNHVLPCSRVPSRGDVTLSPGGRRYRSLDFARELRRGATCLPRPGSAASLASLAAATPLPRSLLLPPGTPRCSRVSSRGDVTLSPGGRRYRPLDFARELRRGATCLP